ncbi:MAG TPA: type VI secretion system protein TssA [Syntrophobacteraceae bacterium]|nr:type VI secretion system protein TssA [Syntrophobacteraceae bacterium]
MSTEFDIDTILAPIPGDNPAGEDLRYTPVYDEIKEARRADDENLPVGDWQREPKKAEWGKVISLGLTALAEKTKDLQIAAWLTEALTATEGFAGLAAGLQILNGLLANFWEHLYPPIEDDDLDYRASPIEFLDDRLWLAIKQVPITEPRKTAGYNWLKWKEARDVGYEAELRSADGAIDDKKRQARQEKLDEGKLKSEDFDIAVALSSEAFYESLTEDLSNCEEQLTIFGNQLDEKFGRKAPSISNFQSAVADCRQTLKRILEKKTPKASQAEAEPEPETEPPKQESFVGRLFRKHRAASREADTEAIKGAPQPSQRNLGGVEDAAMMTEAPPIAMVPADVAASGFDSDALEVARWNAALQTMETDGMKQALGQLLAAAHSAPSVRARNRYRLLMAKLCLEAGRVDLARPLVEELAAFIEELKLERWESPRWIADVQEAHYQCLTWGDPTDEDLGKAMDLFRKLCTTDVTKAMMYKH